MVYCLGLHGFSVYRRFQWLPIQNWTSICVFLLEPGLFSFKDRLSYAMISTGYSLNFSCMLWFMHTKKIVR
jgi:hypothetical protein